MFSDYFFLPAIRVGAIASSASFVFITSLVNEVRYTVVMDRLADLCFSVLGMGPRTKKWDQCKFSMLIFPFPPNLGLFFDDFSKFGSTFWVKNC